MVSFVCGRCSEVLKKTQVARHLYKCNSNAFACLDCNIDFSKASYVGHTKCITEAQKYHGATYQDKVNKGEVKQAQWVELLEEAILYTKEVNVHHLLKSISKFDNVPRKKDKFINFCSQSIRCHNKALMEAAFDAIKAAEDHAKAQQAAIEKSNKEEEEKKNNNGKDVELNGLNLDALKLNGDEKKPVNPNAIFEFAEQIQNILSGKTQPTNYYELCEDLVKLYRDATGDFDTGDVKIVHNIVDTLEEMRRVTFVGDTSYIRRTSGGKK
uniref:Zf-LYAR domain-containing protein n=1 Tax=Panagrellus redivivus TaxID=6233 RepID=A0A7E4ZZS5_PANRE